MADPDYLRQIAAHYNDWQRYQRRFARDRHEAAAREAWGHRNPLERLRSAGGLPCLFHYLEIMGEDLGQWLNAAVGQRACLPVYFWKMSSSETRFRVRQQLERSASAKPAPYLELDLEAAQEQLAAPQLSRRAWHELRTSQDPEARLMALGILTTGARRRGAYQQAAALALHSLEVLPSVGSPAAGIHLSRLHYLPGDQLDLEPALQICHQARRCFESAALVSHVGRTFIDEATLRYHFDQLPHVELLLSVADRLLSPTEYLHRLALAYVRTCVALDHQCCTSEALRHYASLPCPPNFEPSRQAFSDLLAARYALQQGDTGEAADLLWDLLTRGQMPSDAFRTETLFHLAATSVSAHRPTAYRLAVAELKQLALSQASALPPKLIPLVRNLPSNSPTERVGAAVFLRAAAHVRKPGLAAPSR